MDEDVSVEFIKRDLNNIADRAKRENWAIEQSGLFVKVIIQQKHSSIIFRLLLVCHGYPIHPMHATFLPEPLRLGTCLWPNDSERMFRILTSRNKIPFICLAGLQSYNPEEGITETPYTPSDINVANVITRIHQKINENTCKHIEIKI